MSSVSAIHMWRSARARSPSLRTASLMALKPAQSPRTAAAACAPLAELLDLAGGDVGLVVALDGGEDCRGRLLIIDDDPIQSAIVGRIATAAGYETLVVGSIEELPTVAEVISTIVAEAEATLTRLA